MPFQTYKTDIVANGLIPGAFGFFITKNCKFKPNSFDISTVYRFDVINNLHFSSLAHKKVTYFSIC
jgi:hypothetical protein